MSAAPLTIPRLIAKGCLRYDVGANVQVRRQGLLRCERSKVMLCCSKLVMATLL